MRQVSACDWGGTLTEVEHRLENLLGFCLNCVFVSPSLTLFEVNRSKIADARTIDHPALLSTASE